jgi:hypothetical protein
MVLDLLPLEQHPDIGFGTLASSFERAADTLEATHSSSLRNAHLPIAFLRRHAVELYFKSLLIMLHEGLEIPYGGGGRPFDRRVWTGTTWQPLHNTHDLRVLFQNLVELLPIARSMLRENTGLDLTLPLESEQWLTTVALNDPNSTLFRYPQTRDSVRDQEKDSIKPIHFADLFSEIKAPTGRKVMHIATSSSRDVVQVFAHDPTPMAATIVALRSLTGSIGLFQRKLMRQLFGAS